MNAPAPFGARPLPPDLRRDPLAMSDAELAAALRERIDEFNVLWAMARAREIEVEMGLHHSPGAPSPRLALGITKRVAL